MIYNVEKLKNERDRRAMTLTEVAEEAGITVTALQRIESGEGASWKKAIRKVARVLKLEIDELIPQNDNGQAPRRKRSA